MRYWLEIEKDIFSCFEWFTEAEAIKTVGYKPKISVFSIIGVEINNRVDKNNFIEKCSNIINKLDSNLSLLKYKFYLFAIVEESKNPSRMAMYYKLWKKIKREWSIQNFTLGSELEYPANDSYFYIGCAEFNIKEFDNALKIMASNPKKFAIICSKSKDFENENFIKEIFEKIYLKGKKKEIDYAQLALSLLTSKDNIVFRWGDSSEECELDCLVVEENICLFSSL